MTFRSNIAHALLGALGVLAAGRTAGAVELELRVLVVATGSTEDDPGRALIEETLENMGVPFDVLDARSEALTADLLAESAERGRYNGIILTEAEALSANGTTALSAEEIATLHAYERDFGVRESVLTGFPATNAALGVDFGLDEITAYTDLQARWTGRSGDGSPTAARRRPGCAASQWTARACVARPERRAARSTCSPNSSATTGRSRPCTMSATPPSPRTPPSCGPATRPE